MGIALPFLVGSERSVFLHRSASCDSPALKEAWLRYNQYYCFELRWTCTGAET
jgi:hypothetical protein